MTLFFISYFLLVNLFGFYLMYSDKQKAIQHQWRIAESNLFFTCYSGGFIGIYLGMKYLRHKTQHWTFHAAVIISSLFWLIIFPLGAYYLLNFS